MNWWYLLALVILSGSLLFWYAKSRKKKMPRSVVSSRDFIENLYKRRRALKENLASLRKRQDELDREINNLSMEMGSSHHGITPSLARLLVERAQLRTLVISAVVEIRQLDKHIDEVRVLLVRSGDQTQHPRH